MVRRKHHASIVAGSALLILASLFGAVSLPPRPSNLLVRPAGVGLLPAGTRRGTGREDVGGQPRGRRDRAGRSRRIVVVGPPRVRRRSLRHRSWIRRGDVVQRAQREPDRAARSTRLSSSTSATCRRRPASRSARTARSVSRSEASARRRPHHSRRVHRVANDHPSGRAAQRDDGIRRGDLVHAHGREPDGADRARRHDDGVPLPANASGPQWITTGPDGALWFGSHLQRAVVRMTIGGAVTTYPVPTPAAGVNRITVGADGAIWFTESTADAVGRIGLDGAIVEIPRRGRYADRHHDRGRRRDLVQRPGHEPRGAARAVRPADRAAPTVTVVSPARGSVLTDGEGMIADYFCTDEAGGSGVVSCRGPVADGAIVPNRPGSHAFTVTGTDAEGNVGSATHGYVVFEAIGGPITNHSVFTAGRVIRIILELGGHAQDPCSRTDTRWCARCTARPARSWPSSRRPSRRTCRTTAVSWCSGGRRRAGAAARAVRSWSVSGSPAGRAPTPCSPCAPGAGACQPREASCSSIRTRARPARTAGSAPRRRARQAAPRAARATPRTPPRPRRTEDRRELRCRP